MKISLFKSGLWSDEIQYNPKNVKELLKVIVCDTNNRECMKRHCKRCPTSAAALEMPNSAIIDEREAILVNRWNKGMFEAESYAKEEICYWILTQLQKYTAHIYNIYTQNKALRPDKDSLGETSVSIQMDFCRKL